MPDFLPGRVRAFNTDQLESELERWFTGVVRQRGGTAYKFTSPGRRSVPDRMILAAGAHMFFVELKRRGKKATPKQKEEHARLGSYGFRVYVCDTKESCLRVLELEGLYAAR